MSNNHIENRDKLLLIDFFAVSLSLCSKWMVLHLRVYGLFDKARSLMSICTPRRQDTATSSSKASCLFENKYMQALSYHYI